MSGGKRKSIPKAIRDRVKNRFGGKCGYCGEMAKNIHIDHVIPVISSLTSDSESNLMPACFSCNNFKGGMTLREFRNALEENPRKAYDYSVNHRLAVKYKQIEVLSIEIVFYFEREVQDANQT